MADYTPISADNSAITLTAGAVVTGGLLVKLSADDTVIHTVNSTTDKAIGVAAHDAPSGGRVTVWLLPGFMHELTLEVGATAVAGNLAVPSTTSGRVNVTTYSTVSVAPVNVLGVVVRSTVNAAGTKVRVLGL